MFYYHKKMSASPQKEKLIDKKPCDMKHTKFSTLSSMHVFSVGGEIEKT